MPLPQEFEDAKIGLEEYEEYPIDDFFQDIYDRGFNKPGDGEKINTMYRILQKYQWERDFSRPLKRIPKGEASRKDTLVLISQSCRNGAGLVYLPTNNMPLLAKIEELFDEANALAGVDKYQLTYLQKKGLNTWRVKQGIPIPEGAPVDEDAIAPISAPAPAPAPAPVEQVPVNEEPPQEEQVPVVNQPVEQPVEEPAKEEEQPQEMDVWEKAKEGLPDTLQFLTKDEAFDKLQKKGWNKPGDAAFVRHIYALAYELKDEYDYLELAIEDDDCSQQDVIDKAAIGMYNNIPLQKKLHESCVAINNEFMWYHPQHGKKPGPPKDGIEVEPVEEEPVEEEPAEAQEEQKAPEKAQKEEKAQAEAQGEQKAPTGDQVQELEFQPPEEPKQENPDEELNYMADMKFAADMSFEAEANDLLKKMEDEYIAKELVNTSQMALDRAEAQKQHDPDNVVLDTFKAHIMQLSNQAKEKLQELESLQKGSENSREYTAMKNALQKIADYDKKCVPADVNGDLDTLRQTANAYKVSHNKLFKANRRLGRHRMARSKELEIWAYNRYLDAGLSIAMDQMIERELDKKDLYAGKENVEHKKLIKPEDLEKIRSDKGRKTDFHKKREELKNAKGRSTSIRTNPPENGINNPDFS